MDSAKLANPIRSFEIKGVPFRVGKLTVGAALEMEQALSTWPSKLDRLRDSGILDKIDKDKAESLIETAMMDLDFWPPDAITALSDWRILIRAEFGVIFITALLRQYNPGLSPDELATLAKACTKDDLLALQSIAFGNDPFEKKVTATETTPTVEPPLTVAPDPGSNGTNASQE